MSNYKELVATFGQTRFTPLARSGLLQRSLDVSILFDLFDFLLQFVGCL
jgi:hypothetical protein